MRGLAVNAEALTALSRSECPVVVYHGSGVLPEAVRGWGWKCYDCGDELADHPFVLRLSVGASMAFAVNPDRMRRWPDE